MKYMLHLLGVLVASVCLANVIRVPEDYQTIQLAYTACIVGDTISIAEGIYYETVEVENKFAKFIGEIDDINNPATVIRSSTNGIECTGQFYMENVKIEKIGNRHSYGVYLFGGCTLRNVEITNFTYSIYMLPGEVKLYDCYLHDNTYSTNRYNSFEFYSCKLYDSFLFDWAWLSPDTYGKIERSIIGCLSGITMNDGIVEIKNCTFDYLQGINTMAATLKISNCILPQPFNSNVNGSDSLFFINNYLNFNVQSINVDPASFLLFQDNITADPLISDNFHLLPGSPCIDAGDPSSPLDPDGTRADIGAYYFCQGEGVHLPDILRVTAEPEYPGQLTATLQSTCDAVVIDSAYTDTGLFQLDPNYPRQVASDYSTGTFHLTFSPTQQGLYADTLHIWANTDPPHLKIPLVGEAGPIPAPVADLAIAILPDLSAQLTWSPVTETIYGNPVTPDYYLIFYNELDPQVEEEWYYQGAVATPGYLHFMVARFADVMNYRVVAWKGINPALLGWKNGVKATDLRLGTSFAKEEDR